MKQGKRRETFEKGTQQINERTAYAQVFKRII